MMDSASGAEVSRIVARPSPPSILTVSGTTLPSTESSPQDRCDSRNGAPSLRRSSLTAFGEPDGYPALCGGAGLFPPGPGDTGGWSAVLDHAPDIAPAASPRDLKRAADHYAALVASGWMAEAEAQSRLRRMADGLAGRPRALRVLGNGVVPLAAAYAWRSLAAAHGLRPVDLGAEE